MMMMTTMGTKLGESKAVLMKKSVIHECRKLLTFSLSITGKEDFFHKWGANLILVLIMNLIDQHR